MNYGYLILFKRAAKSLLALIIATSIQIDVVAQTVQENSVFQWVGSMNKLMQLDSLIQHSGSSALNHTDYNTIILKKYIQQGGNLNSYKDSLATELAIQRVATHFFNDLAYGNKPPVLDYRGAKFNMTTFNIPSLIKAYNKNNNLNTLVTYLNQQSTEVKIILDTLKKLRLAASKNQHKIKTLITAANNYRWLNAIRQNQRIVLVNIPSAQLKVYEGYKMNFQMRLILGKESTPTKTLSAYISQVTINPYWTVPNSIIIKEMIPKIKSDENYLSRNHLEVLNNNYKPINPSQINWYTVDTIHFPYVVRQSTGCENSLGILKLEFENPFAIYLHDTPEKELFKLKTRFFSHGCMRMENPVALGRLLLEDNLKAIDSIDLTKCYQNPKPIYIPITNKTPLVVWYNQVDFDSNNNLLFYKNVYNR